MTRFPLDDLHHQVGNTCGPNSAARLLRGLGLADLAPDELIREVRRQHPVPRFGFGAPPGVLARVMNQYPRPGGRPFRVVHGADLGRVAATLAAGRPMLALIQTRADDSIALGPWRWTVPYLHWIALDGWDAEAGAVGFTDTDGTREAWAGARFERVWGWDFGRSVNLGLRAAGVRPRTVIVEASGGSGSTTEFARFSQTPQAA